MTAGRDGRWLTGLSLADIGIRLTTPAPIPIPEAALLLSPAAFVDGFATAATIPS